MRDRDVTGVQTCALPISGHLFEHSGRDMVTSGLAGAFPTLQVRVFEHHVFPELVLALDQLFLVSYDLLGAEPAIRSQRDKRKVQERKSVVQAKRQEQSRQ